MFENKILHSNIQITNGFALVYAQAPKEGVYATKCENL